MSTQTTNTRKSISKKIRFEIFKRDKFTCQFCGNSAPNSILEIDHLNPVSKGGNNSILNLITSCYDDIESIKETCKSAYNWGDFIKYFSE